jgi:hypothetical protein
MQGECPLFKFCMFLEEGKAGSYSSWIYYDVGATSRAGLLSPSYPWDADNEKCFGQLLQHVKLRLIVPP